MSASTQWFGFGGAESSEEKAAAQSTDVDGGDDEEEEQGSFMRRFSEMLSPASKKLAAAVSAEASERLPAPVATSMQQKRRIKRTSLRQQVQDAILAGAVEALPARRSACEWHEPDGGAGFRVRAAEYLANRAKVPVLHARAELLHVDVVDSSQLDCGWDGAPLEGADAGRLDHACAEPGGLAQYCKRRWCSLPPRRLFLFAVNFQLPHGVVAVDDPAALADEVAGRFSIVAYFGLPPLAALLADDAPDDSFARLLGSFVAGSDLGGGASAQPVEDRGSGGPVGCAAADAWRGDRFKVVPRLAEGNWALRKLVGETPCVIGRSTKMGLRYFTDGVGRDWSTYSYMEVCVDTSTSTFASPIVSQLMASAIDVAAEIGLMIEAALVSMLQPLTLRRAPATSMAAMTAEAATSIVTTTAS
eukprot:g792.t1